MKMSIYKIHFALPIENYNLKNVVQVDNVW